MAGLNKVKSVMWQQGEGLDDGNINAHQFDNTVLSTADVSELPIRAAAWLFGIGIIDLFGMRRQSIA